MSWAALAAFATVPVAALDPAKRVDQYLVETWNASDLFGAKTVFAIRQTRDGYLWLGSSAGLLRYDGFRFVLFEPANTPAFDATEVRALLETADGDLYIGVYGGGVVRLRAGQFEHLGPAAGLASPLVRALAASADGSVWVGSQGGGVARLRDGAVVETLGRADGLPRDEVRALLETRAGELFVGTEKGGLSRWRDHQLRHYRAADGLLGDTVMAIAEDPGGDLWVATTQALHRLDRGSDRLEPYPVAAGLASGYVFSLALDRHHNLWVGTGGAGLSRLAGGRFASLATTNGLPNDYVWAFHEDRSGSLWVGTEGGLVRLRDSPFTMWGARQGLPADQVHGLLEDRQGVLWVAGPKGLSRVEGGLGEGRIEVLGRPDGLPSEVTRALLEARDGSLWVSTDGAGLAHLEKGRVTTYTAESGLGDNMVWSLAQGSDGAIWAGTQNLGVARFASGRWTFFSQKDGLGANCVRALWVDHAGDLWAGTLGGGVSRIHGEEITTYTTRDGLGGDSVIALYEDPAHHLWVGSLAGGLSLFLGAGPGPNFRSFDRRRGFFADAVGSIQSDDFGYLWINAKGGPFRVRQDELLALFRDPARQRAEPLAVSSFGKSGGFLGAAGAGFTPTVGKTRSGQLIYASSQGIAAIDPAKVAAWPGPAAPILESLLANHQPVDLNQKPILPAGTFDLEIHYTAPSLDAPEKTRFRYRLEGFDHDWLEVGERRVAYYPNLPPGEYLFRAAATATGRDWVESAALPVVLLPYFYQTRLFKALLLGLLLAAFYGLYRLRAGRLETRAAVAEERNRLAREIHDTLAQDLTAILMQARLAQRADPAATPPLLETIAGLAAASLTEARRSLQALRPPALDGKTLAEALRETAASLEARHGVAISFSTTGASEIDPVVEVELLRIAKEALHNALRHGGARHLELSLDSDADATTLVVSDDGCGFDPATTGGGFGLLGMRERAEALGAKLSLQSSAGRGTRIEVRAPRPGREKG